MHSKVAVMGLLTTVAMAGIPQGAQPDVYEALKGLHVIADGYLHIADDGVARSYKAQGIVDSYVKLSNTQLRQYLADLTYPPATMDHLHEIFDRADGQTVSDQDQLTNPPSSLRAIPFVVQTSVVQTTSQQDSQSTDQPTSVSTNTATATSDSSKLVRRTTSESASQTASQTASAVTSSAKPSDASADIVSCAKNSDCPSSKFMGCMYIDNFTLSTDGMCYAPPATA